MSDALFQSYWSKLSSNVPPYFNLLVHVYRRTQFWRGEPGEPRRERDFNERSVLGLFKNFFDPSLPNCSKLVFQQGRSSSSEMENYDSTRLFLARRSLWTSLPRNLPWKHWKLLLTTFDRLFQSFLFFSSSFPFPWVSAWKGKKKKEVHGEVISEIPRKFLMNLICIERRLYRE